MNLIRLGFCVRLLLRLITFLISVERFLGVVCCGRTVHAVRHDDFRRNFAGDGREIEERIATKKTIVKLRHAGKKKTVLDSPAQQNGQDGEAGGARGVRGQEQAVPVVPAGVGSE